eukprot:CAMPEP_0182446470 /NCGR_PEP_ID=MMETSP1172-20130603/4223_1 /TAXON_ID=708627 /ORGANISM="Timspurckia oligopyrenoides, Strain CCMP3278" /LENGTH=362 /DNA_ID=CAMNT_0024642403 /DNA_START=21 /DNA_END=1109 /DNA_ORIENTATION=+
MENTEKVVHELCIEMNTFESLLSSFIKTQMRLKLGEDNYQSFLPSNGGTDSMKTKYGTKEIFRILRDRWISVFSDTVLNVSGIQTIVNDYFQSSVLKSIPNSNECRCIRQNLSQFNDQKLIQDCVKLKNVLNFLSLIVKPVVKNEVEFENKQEFDNNGQQMSNATRKPDEHEFAMDLGEDFVVESPQIEQRQQNFFGTVVLDGPNVGWRHGQNVKFSWNGIFLALHWFYSRKFYPIAFIPESRISALRSESIQNSSLEMISKQLEYWTGMHCIVVTPKDDYDDVYSLDYARRNGCLLVSNDKLDDHVIQAAAISEQNKMDLSNWLDQCRLSFTFHVDEFLPNPAFDYPSALHYAHLHRSTPL